MELNQLETKIVEKTVREASEIQVRELNDLQLAFVGGGIGDTAV
jgi:hypothetical protein